MLLCDVTMTLMRQEKIGNIFFLKQHICFLKKMNINHFYPKMHTAAQISTKRPALIGRGFAECQILKKWKWPDLLNWVEYFYKLLRKHWYWQDLAQEIAKWHFSLVEALPSSKFWKSDNGAVSWTHWNIVMKFCIHIDIDKMYPMRLSNDIWDWLSFCRGSKSEKSETIAKWHLSSVEALPSAKFWKSENGLISWTELNILIDFCVNIDIIKI